MKKLWMLLLSILLISCSGPDPVQTARVAADSVGSALSMAGQGVFGGRQAPQAAQKEALAAPRSLLIRGRWTKSAFKALVNGKTEAEVLALLGKPYAADGDVGQGNRRYTYISSDTYAWSVVDDVAGSQVSASNVAFDLDGKVDDAFFS